jgi:hypothetical protein
MVVISTLFYYSSESMINEPMTGGDWSSKRLEITCEEARSVFDAQQKTLSDIDDKAMRTVRITAIILGVIVSLARFAADVFNQYAAGIGGAIL